MKKTGYLLYAVIAIGGTLFFIFNQSKTEKAGFKERYKNYLAAPGKIIAKQQHIGPKAKVLVTYTVAFTTADGKEYKQTSGNTIGTGLANSFEKGDTLTVFYNPANPYDPVIDRTGMEAGTNVFNYNNIIPYAVGAIVLVLAIFYYGKKTKMNTENA